MFSTLYVKYDHIPKASEEEIQAARAGPQATPLPQPDRDLSQEPTANQKPDPLVNFFKEGGGAQPEVAKVTRIQSNSEAEITVAC